MSIYTFPNITSGMDQALISLGSSVPSFIIMFLIFIFGTILIGGSLSQQRRTGYADLPMWATVASLCTLVVAMPLTLTAGILQSDILVILVSITILSGLWLFFNKNRNEI